MGVQSLRLSFPLPLLPSNHHHVLPCHFAPFSPTFPRIPPHFLSIQIWSLEDLYAGLCRTMFELLYGFLLRILILFLNSCTLLYPPCDTNTRFVCQRSLGAAGSFGKDMQSRTPADLRKFLSGSDQVLTTFIELHSS